MLNLTPKLSKHDSWPVKMKSNPFFIAVPTLTSVFGVHMWIREYVGGKGKSLAVSLLKGNRYLSPKAFAIVQHVPLPSRQQLQINVFLWFSYSEVSDSSPPNIEKLLFIVGGLWGGAYRREWRMWGGWLWAVSPPLHGLQETASYFWKNGVPGVICICYWTSCLPAWRRVADVLRVIALSCALMWCVLPRAASKTVTIAVSGTAVTALLRRTEKGEVMYCKTKKKKIT